MGTQITKLSFKGEILYIGIDTHKKNWRVAIFHKELNIKVFSAEPDPLKLIRYLKKNYPEADFRCVYEAGFCGFWIHDAIKEQGVKCLVVNPADVPTTHKEKEFKDDTHDCRKLAKALMSNNIEGIYTPSNQELEYRSVVRLYEDKVKARTRAKNKIKASLEFYGIKYPEQFKNSGTHWSRAFYSWLSGITLNEEYGTMVFQELVTDWQDAELAVKRLKKSVNSLSELPRFKKHVSLLKTIPGISTITAMKLLTELHNIERFPNLNKLCAFLGLIPSTNSSGEKDRIGDITKRGNKHLKSAIIESAWTSIKHDPVLSLKYIKLKQKMDGNKAIIRIAKKLLARIMFVLLNEQPYVIGVVK